MTIERQTRSAFAYRDTRVLPSVQDQPESSGARGHETVPPTVPVVHERPAYLGHT